MGEIGGKHCGPASQSRGRSASTELFQPGQPPFEAFTTKIHPPERVGRTGTRDRVNRAKKLLLRFDVCLACLSTRMVCAFSNRFFCTDLCSIVRPFFFAFLFYFRVVRHLEKCLHTPCSGNFRGNCSLNF